MTLLNTSISLFLLAAAPAMADSASQGLRLHEGHPAGFKVDGALGEWKALPPSLSLGREQQVAGTSQVTSPQDLSAQLWVAVGPEGLAVAGEVRDDRVFLSATPEQIHHDHLELWLALPQPEMPPLAFVNQFGEHPLATVDACDDSEVVTSGDPAACRAWWKKQTERRKQLVRPFIAQYGLMSGGVVHFGKKGTVGPVRYELMEGGYRFEALIPASAFPRSAEAPLRDLKVLVSLVDNDENKNKLETFLSSVKGQRFGDSSTFQAVKLAQPLRFGAWPELFERALKSNERSSYQPGPDVRTFEVWLNPARGYQYSPELPSPEVVSVDLSKMEPQASLNDIEVLTVPAQVEPTGSLGHWLVSRRDKALLDTRYSGTRTVLNTRRPPGLHLLLVTEGIQSLLGTGTCGACPMVSFEVVPMDERGRFAQAMSLEGAASQGEKVEWDASLDLSRIDAFILGAEGKSRQLDARYTWNPKTGRYDEKRFEPPATP
ncbi:hypothetical protein D7X30_26535 [Corallococcus sp. AB011P]|uniref:hypothetical protein n=1 Tax=Corallococcus sp. AB011P TaxID=2316735 RepID=UPI000EA37CFB|nr:hypothetical protein [Corallococcus sp. AB011P]RKG55396.1 hypothetical protein D7X30_26535 [Corallococcus sp. AB011P]